MKRFLNDKSGEVDKRILVLACIAIIFVFSFVRLKKTIVCTTKKTDSRWTLVLFTDKTKDIKSTEECAVDGKSEETEDIPNPTPTNPGDIDPTVPTVPFEPVPISYYETGEMSLSCTNMQAYHNFTIPSTASDGTKGTRALTVENRKGWKIWMRVKEVKGENGLTASAVSTKYVEIPNGKNATFEINWTWNPGTGYTGPRGSARVLFESVCVQPTDEEVGVIRPSAVKNFKTTHQTASTISLEWDAVHGAAYYQIWRYDYSSNTWAQIHETTATNFVDTGLDPSSKFKYTIYARNAAGASPATTLETMTKDPPYWLEAPTNLKIKEATSNSLHISWSPVKDATTYTVITDNKTYYSGPATEFNLTGLPNADYPYIVYIRASNEQASSKWSAILGRTLPTNGLGVNPPEVRVTSKTNTTMNVEWTSVTGANLYKLVVNGNTVFYGNATSFNVQNLTPGSFYYFQVWAGKDNGSNHVFATKYGFTQEYSEGTKTAPPAPKPTTASPTENSVQVRWPGVLGADYYVIEVDGKTVWSNTQTSATINGLNPNTTYTFKVKAVNNAGSSPWGSAQGRTEMKRFDDGENLSQTCTSNTTKHTFKLPSNLIPGSGGQFDIKVKNTSASAIRTKIETINKRGGLFEGLTPVQLIQSYEWTRIEPAKEASILVQWELMRAADPSYMTKTGEVDIFVKTVCE